MPSHPRHHTQRCNWLHCPPIDCRTRARNSCAVSAENDGGEHEYVTALQMSVAVAVKDPEAGHVMGGRLGQVICGGVLSCTLTLNEQLLDRPQAVRDRARHSSAAQQIGIAPLTLVHVTDDVKSPVERRNQHCIRDRGRAISGALGAHVRRTGNGWRLRGHGDGERTRRGQTQPRSWPRK